MAIFDLSDKRPVGKVQSVDTASVVVKVAESDMLSQLQVNHLVIIRASRAGQYLIGMVVKIMRKFDDDIGVDEEGAGDDMEELHSCDIVKITLIGTFLDKVGTASNQFKRTLESVPDIDADCFVMDSTTLTEFMGAISEEGKNKKNPLSIGTYTLNDNAKAWLDGNKLFQRHAVIVGSTGSGKSYTVATIIEQVAKLKSANAILFDIHGEYAPIVGEGIKHYKIAGPSDKVSDEVMFLPYWLLTYDEMLSMLLDRSDNNAPNQAMVFSQFVLKAKQDYLEQISNKGVFTIDSPIPYRMDEVVKEINAKNTEMVPGKNTEKQGDFYGKLSRFIQRLEAKIADKRLNFMFCPESALLDNGYMETLCKRLMAPASQGGGVKIVDFSEVPSDVLPLMVSLIARVVFSVQQWMEKTQLHPIALFCDEAHLYMPEDVGQGMDSTSLASFERIAKEGRKYGVGLVVVSQRPSEVNRTVLSQSSNFIAMRLTNVDDQNVVRRLLPDSIGNFADLLPILDIGEALVVGDASLLPSRIRIDKPSQEPASGTINFWTEWSKDTAPDNIAVAVEAMRRQSRV